MRVSTPLAAWRGWRDDGSRLAWSTLVVVAFATWGAVLTTVLLSGDKLHSLPLIVGTLLPFVMAASRNVRLFLLMSAIASAVFGLSANIDFRPHIGGAASYSIELVDIFTLPLLALLVTDRLTGRQQAFRLSGISAWWLGLMALGLVDLVLGPFRQYVAFELLRMFKCWLLFLVIINECRRERQFQHVLTALAWAMMLNVVIAFAQRVLERSLGLQVLGEAGEGAVLGANLGVYGFAADVYRVSGLVGHPNLFSTYLAMLLSMFIAGLFADHQPGKRLWLSALVLAGLVALLLTLSRTGWADFAAGMVVVLGFLYFHPAQRQRLTRLRLGLMIGLGVAVAYATPVILRRLLASEPGALDSRYEMMGVAWRMVQAEPVFGFGLNSFSYQMFDYAPYSVGRMIEIYGEVPTVVHNIYMLVWAEQGTLGLLLFLGMNAHLLWMAWRTTRRSASHLILTVNIGALAAMVAVMIDGLGSFYMRVPGPARIFWIVAGLIVASHLCNQTLLRARAASAGRVAPDSRIR